MTLYSTENISLLSFCANYIKQATHLYFGNNDCSHVFTFNKPISQTVFMLSIAINRGEHV